METVITGEDAQYRHERGRSRSVSVLRLWSLNTRSSIKELDGMIVFTRKVSDKQLIRNDSHIVNQSYTDVVKSAIPTDTGVS